MNASDALAVRATLLHEIAGRRDQDAMTRAYNGEPQPHTPGEHAAAAADGLLALTRAQGPRGRRDAALTLAGCALALLEQIEQEARQ